MEKDQYFAHVKCDYNDGDGFWCVDAWKTDDDNEEGRVVAIIHEDTGQVYRICPEAHISIAVQKVISAKQKEIYEAAKKKLQHVWVVEYASYEDSLEIISKVFKEENKAREYFHYVINDIKTEAEQRGWPENDLYEEGMDWYVANSWDEAIELRVEINKKEVVYDEDR